MKKFLHFQGVQNTSKEPRGKAGVQPVRVGQVRRGKWPITILLELSQHAVVEVRFLLQTIDSPGCCPEIAAEGEGMFLFFSFCFCSVPVSGSSVE